jgi:hypothetical protein
MDFDLMRIIGSFRSEFHRRLGDVYIPPNALYLHFRGGDIFQVRPSSYYAQPPCRFYAEATKLHVNISRIILVAQDKTNVCVGELLQLGGDLYLNDLFETVRVLIHAEGFVLSRSTFALAAVFLSKYAEIGRFYTFGYKWPDIGPHWNCIPTRTFAKEVISTWTRSPKQVEMVMTETCAIWDYVNLRFPVNPYHGKDGTPFLD